MSQNHTYPQIYPYSCHLHSYPNPHFSPFKVNSVNCNLIIPFSDKHFSYFYFKSLIISTLIFSISHFSIPFSPFSATKLSRTIPCSFFNLSCFFYILLNTTIILSIFYFILHSTPFINFVLSHCNYFIFPITFVIILFFYVYLFCKDCNIPLNSRYCYSWAAIACCYLYFASLNSFSLRLSISFINEFIISTIPLSISFFSFNNYLYCPTNSFPSLYNDPYNIFNCLS